MALTARDREVAALAKAAAATSSSPPADHRPVVAAALAPAAPLRLPRWEIEGTSRACVEIAGDLFDYSPAAKGRISCILVETSLRGLPAAFVASEIKGLYRAMAPSHDSASVLLDSIGAAIGPRLPEDAEIHATVCVADPETGTTEIARAGKANPPILWRAGTKALEKVEVDGPPIRRKPSSAGRVEVELDSRDRLTFVSDGLFRVRNTMKEKFGEQRLDGLVLKFGPMNSTAFVNMVVNEVDLFHEGASQRDDLTVLTVRRIQ
jgi:serine phosphatase RsbU (regulator of sigma subunit)